MVNSLLVFNKFWFTCMVFCVQSSKHKALTLIWIHNLVFDFFSIRIKKFVKKRVKRAKARCFRIILWTLKTWNLLQMPPKYTYIFRRNIKIEKKDFCYLLTYLCGQTALLPVGSALTSFRLGEFMSSLAKLRSSSILLFWNLSAKIFGVFSSLSCLSRLTRGVLIHCKCTYFNIETN